MLHTTNPIRYHCIGFSWKATPISHQPLRNTESLDERTLHVLVLIHAYVVFGGFRSILEYGIKRGYSARVIPCEGLMVSIPISPQPVAPTYTTRYVHTIPILILIVGVENQSTNLNTLPWANIISLKLGIHECRMWDPPRASVGL